MSEGLRRPATDLPPAAELTAAELATPAELAAPEVPSTEGLSAASQPRPLTRSRKVTIAIVLTIAAFEVGLGVFLTHPRAHHLLASPSPAGSGRTRHAPARQPPAPPRRHRRSPRGHPGNLAWSRAA